MTDKFYPSSRHLRGRETDTLCSTTGCTNYCMLSSSRGEESTKCGVCMAVQMLSARITELENKAHVANAVANGEVITGTVLGIDSK